MLALRITHTRTHKYIVGTMQGFFLTLKEMIHTATLYFKRVHLHINHVATLITVG
jgi:hypothetical protein